MLWSKFRINALLYWYIQRLPPHRSLEQEINAMVGMSDPETARPTAPQPGPAGPCRSVSALGSPLAGGSRILFGPGIATDMRTRKPREAWHGFHRGSWTRTVRSDAEVPVAPNPVASTAPLGSSFRAIPPLPPNPACGLMHMPPMQMPELKSMAARLDSYHST